MADREEWRADNSLVYLSGHKIAILMRGPDDSNQFVLQAELPTAVTPHKRSFGHGDVLMFKIIGHMLSVSIQKFVILALSNTMDTGVRGSTEIVS